MTRNIALCLAVLFALAVVSADAQAPPATALAEAELLLNDPRPCIPVPGQRGCDPLREALWNGEAAAWAARGVRDGDARFRETVIFRVRAGDPAAIAAIARALGVPYLKITRVRFGLPNESVTVTNLGGGAQEMSGWTLRSPDRGRTYSFPTGLILSAGGSFGVPSVLGAGGMSVGGTSFGGGDVWPDGGGRAVLFYDALDLPGDDTRYSADPANQPPPPDLQVVRPVLRPEQIDPALAREIAVTVPFLTQQASGLERPYTGDCQSTPRAANTLCTLVRPLNQAGDVVRVAIEPEGAVIFVRRDGRWSPMIGTFPGGA